MTDYPGIDYGMGTTNIDPQTGIRFGVIPANDVAWWYDSAESDYGSPHCPHCGNEATPLIEIDDTDDFDHNGSDFGCVDCKHSFWSDAAYGDEPLAWFINDGEYQVTQSGNDCDIFVLKSPFYTRAQFCSPCAPGAAYLRSPCADGPRVYCFGADWFDVDNPCPYPVYRVDEIDPVTGDDPAPRYTPAIETDDIAE